MKVETELLLWHAGTNVEVQLSFLSLGVQEGREASTGGFNPMSSTVLFLVLEG